MRIEVMKVWQGSGAMVSVRGVYVWYNPVMNVWCDRSNRVQSTGSHLLGEL